MPAKTLNSLCKCSSLIFKPPHRSVQLPWLCYYGVRSAMHLFAHQTTEPFLYQLYHTALLWTHQNQCSQAMSSV